MKIALLSLLLFVEFDNTSILDRIALSGRCATLAETPDFRVSPTVRVAPGQPPLLSFRTYQSRLHGHFANSDLMLDDAGH